jgi:uncharacterized membrane protein
MKKIIATLTLFFPAVAAANGADGGFMHWGGMMGGGFGYGLGALLYVVWLLVGIFAAIWLWQQITKK